MKLYGKVVEFDGFCGKIIGADNQEYLILKEEINGTIKKNDLVMFVPEKFEDPELSKKIARFITTIKE